MGDPLAARSRLSVRRAADVFTDRLPLSEAFGSALRRHRRVVDQGAVGFDVPHHNLVHFHGVDGIGKSELLRRLERWTTGDTRIASLWGEPPVSDAITTRFDLGDPWDVDRILLTLRAAAARAGVRTRAFDVGILARWESYRPNEDLPSALDRGPSIGPVPLGTTVKEGAAAALKAAGLPFGAGIIADLIAKRMLSQLKSVAREQTIADCPALEEVLPYVATERNEYAACSLGLLLDWDLGTAASEPPFLVFADSGDRLRSDRRLDTLMRRLVYSTPRILWVLAGDDWLDWTSGELGGRWPDLAPGAAEPAQHLVDRLSRADADEFLRQVLTDSDGAPLLDAACRERIVRAADGVPLYLDLAVMDAQRLLAASIRLEPGDFGGPLTEMVEKLAATLHGDERRALCAAALMTSFDAHLVAAGADVAATTAYLLGERSLVAPRAGGERGLHASVREAVLALPAERGGLRHEDRLAIGRRMLDELNRRRRGAGALEERLDAALRAFDIADALDLHVPWVLPTLLRHPRREQVGVRLAGRARSGSEGWSRSVERLFGCWLEASEPPPLDERLSALAADPATDAEVAGVAERLRAYRLRTLTRHSEAGAILARLRAREGRPGLLHFQHGLTLVALGRFREARALADRLAAAEKESWADRLRGEIALQHGWVQTAADAARRRAEHAEKIGDEWNAVELRVAAARRHALAGGTDALRSISTARKLAKRRFAAGQLRSALCSQALHHAGDRRAVDCLVDRAMAAARLAREDEVTAHELLAWTFDAAVRDDAVRIGELRALIAEHPRTRDARWARPIAWWQAWVLDERPPDDDGDWLESVEKVRLRWIAVAERRRQPA